MTNTFKKKYLAPLGKNSNLKLIVGLILLNSEWLTSTKQITHASKEKLPFASQCNE